MDYQLIIEAEGSVVPTEKIHTVIDSSFLPRVGEEIDLMLSDGHGESPKGVVTSVKHLINFNGRGSLPFEMPAVMVHVSSEHYRRINAAVIERLREVDQDWRIVLYRE